MLELALVYFDLHRCRAAGTRAHRAGVLIAVRHAGLASTTLRTANFRYRHPKLASLCGKAGVVGKQVGLTAPPSSQSRVASTLEARFNPSH